MQPGHLTEASNVFLGKFSNRDSIILPVDLQDYPTGYTAEDLFFEYENRCGFQEYPMDGFQVYPDASSSMIFNTARFHQQNEMESWVFYPVYVVNETGSAKYFHLQNSIMLAIHEAIDNDDDNPLTTWSPIEHRPPMNCTRSDKYIKVLPGEFLMFMMPKYHGHHVTMLRVRIRNGDNTMVSQPFPGNIDQNQFLFKAGDDVNKSIDYWPGYLDWFFYGAVPKGFDKRA